MADLNKQIIKRQKEEAKRAKKRQKELRDEAKRQHEILRLKKRTELFEAQAREHRAKASRHGKKHGVSLHRVLGLPKGKRKKSGWY